MDLEKKHQQLYDKIPKFECKTGCVGCCGPVFFSKWEWDRVSDKRYATEKDRKNLTCPYAVNGKCDIYEQRPLICRMFGAVDTPRLKCPNKCRPVGMLTEAKGQEIMKEYFEIEKQGG